MTLLKLPAGTDVAEMALFAASDMPTRLPRGDDELATLERANKLLRFPTGSDGSYLLHAYVDEPMPDDMRSRCSIEDKIEGALEIPDGRIAFGGLESCSRDFDSNDRIRSDAVLAAGTYDVIAYRTEGLGDAYEIELAKLDTRTGVAARWVRRLPALPVVAAIPFLLYAIVSGSLWMGLGVALAAAVLNRVLARMPAVAKVAADHESASREIALRYPSMVAELRRR